MNYIHHSPFLIASNILKNNGMPSTVNMLNLEELDLSWNKLELLPPDFLASMKKLKAISYRMPHQGLSFLHPGATQG